MSGFGYLSVTVLWTIVIHVHDVYSGLVVTCSGVKLPCMMNSTADEDR